MTDKDKIIVELMEQNRLLIEENHRLRVDVQTLQDRIAALEKDSNTSSKPPSSDIVKPDRTRRKPGKRNKGGQPGHRKHTRKPFKPEDVDQVVEYELTTADAQGLVPLDEWRIFQQIDLPEKLFHVTEHRASYYTDPHTGQRFIASLPDEIRRGGLLSNRTTAMIAFMKGQCHMSFSTIQTFFKEVMGVKLSRGLLNKSVMKVSAALEPSHEALQKQLKHEPVLGIDETGHQNGKLGRPWTWCFQTNRFSFFHIAMTRGSKALIDILGHSFNGIINCDYWGAYRKFSRLYDVGVQYCMAHLIREVRFFAEHNNKKLKRWGQALLDELIKLFHTLHRSERYTLQGYKRIMSSIQKRFLSQMRKPPDHKPARALSKRFDGELANHYFRFLTTPGVEPTNNATERAIRHTVIDRRVTQGTRGDAGMRWCERIWTTIATCQKQQRNVFEFIHQSLAAHWTQKPYPNLL